MVRRTSSAVCVSLFAFVLLAPNAFAQDAPAAVPAVACPLNGNIEVLWNGTWYAATIKAGPNEASQCQIGYDGYESSWDEWVGADRMRPVQAPCPLNGEIEVLWNDAWYAATIKAGPNESGQCQIGYDGYESSWDEWVGDDRMRPRQ